MKAMSQTKAQKAYSAACDACRAWASSATPEILRYAQGSSVARSYGIKAADACNIITKACRERNI